MKNWFSLEGHVCIVAGSQGLLGSSVVKALSDSGAQIIGFDRGLIRKNETYESFDEVDISNENRLNEFFAGLSFEKNTNLAFINCSYPRTESWGKLAFENVGMEELNENLKIHLGSHFHFSQLAVKKMKELGNGGSLVNFGSIYGILGPDLRIYEGTAMNNPAPYAAIKSGIIGFTRYIATSYGQLGIRANVVCPGGIENGQPESFIQAYSQRTPMARMGKADDIAGIVAFLAGPAATYVSGQVISVDGGWSAW